MMLGWKLLVMMVISRSKSRIRIGYLVKFGLKSSVELKLREWVGGKRSDRRETARDGMSELAKISWEFVPNI